MQLSTYKAHRSTSRLIRPDLKIPPLESKNLTCATLRGHISNLADRVLLKIVSMLCSRMGTWAFCKNVT